MTWATRITVLRLLLIPVFVGLLIEQKVAVVQGFSGQEARLGAFGVFTIAALSDALDGFLARYYNQRSALGALLDPVADKLLLLAALLMLGVFYPSSMMPLPWFLLVVILARDTILLVGYLTLRYSGRAVEVRPNWAGKLSTFAIFMAIGAVLLQWTSSIFIFSAVGASSACWGFIHYAHAGWKQWNNSH